ncbi:MAG TPA: TolC family protein [Acidobacteriota bacterium]|nr:TolC family protein [Acidobacteriota bacterium]
MLNKDDKSLILQVLLLVMLAQPLAAQQPPSDTGRPPIPLTLREAVDMALAADGNVRVRLAGQAVEGAEARAAQARAALLPNFDATLAEQNQTRNLAAFGIRISVPIPGFTFPEVVGPFSTFDARTSASQTIFDFSAIRRFQAARTGVSTAESEEQNQQEAVAAEVGRYYLAAWQARNRVDTVRASVELAEALLELATNQKAAGTGTGIEVTRARVQLANEQQRLLVAQNQYRAAELRLLKAIGLKLTDRIEITEQFGYDPVSITLDEAVEKAITSRPDLQAQREREKAARLNYSAVKWERLPSFVAFGDYGTIGSAVTEAVPTRTYGVMMRLPIFDGGARDARRGEARAQFEQERIRTADLEAQIEMEVRLAFDNLQSAEAQIRVAEEGVRLAEAELAQARRRYGAGVTTSLEVTDAQTRLERAQDNRIAATFNFQVAKIELAQAMGSLREILR